MASPTNIDSMSAAQLLSFDFSQLSVGDRLTLIRKICDSIEGEESFHISDKQWAEYDRRLQEADEHPEILLTLDQLKARMDATR